ncbi:MAG: hypothetical protein ACT4OE_05290, partial [Sphingosinicella sp.]
MSEEILLWIAGGLVVLLAIFLLLRPRRQRLVRSDGDRGADEPGRASRERPYMKPREGGGVTGEVAAATTDVAGEVLGVEARRALSGGEGAKGAAVDLGRLKGVGPKFVAQLHALGITRFDQLAHSSPTELALLDERLGPFRGRLARDRV